MRSSVISSIFCSLACFQAVDAIFPPKPRVPLLGLNDVEAAALANSSEPLVGTAFFEQYIDHANPKLGTFKQQYWYNATNWKGPGSPIVFFTPGEAAAAPYSGYLTERALTGLFGKALGGAVILFEHRYWGNSTPFEVQSTENLQYLTLDNSVADFTHFARTVKLPFDNSTASNAPKAPWVYTGGSYSGALAAWIYAISPGTFWAYHGSSGPVEAIYDYWTYFQPIQQGMAQNCSKDYTAIIDHVDQVLTTGSPKQQADLKAMFGMTNLTHNDDVSSGIASPIYAWQSIQFDSGYSQFFQMCDAIEGVIPNKTGVAYSANGVGLAKALPNFAKWFTTEFLPGNCASYGYEEWADEMSVGCFETYDPKMPAFTDWSDENAFDRTWVWFCCNEPFFYWQGGAPPGIPTVMSRLTTADYYQRQCNLYFPEQGPFTYGSNHGRRTAAQLNAHTKGWDLTNTKRFMWANGEFDPWRSAGVSSVFRPGGPLQSTPQAPVFLMEGARHCNDLLVRNAVHPSVAETQAAEVKLMTQWVDEFYQQSGQKQKRKSRPLRSGVGARIEAAPWLKNP